MFERVLVALDGSPRSERILAALEPFAQQPSSEVLLARVVGPKPGDAEEQVQALSYVRSLEARLDAKGLRASGHVLVGRDPAVELASFAAKSGASLVAIATHGRAGLRRVVLGSVAERVVRVADRPVLIVNPWALEAPLALGRVVVALDGSEAAEGALPIAAGLARGFGSELILVHVEEVEALDSLVAVAQEHRKTEKTFERARRSLADARVRTVVRSGVPHAELLDSILETAPGLVVLTTHGRTGLARIALGSVAEAVIRGAPCPVLVKRSVPALAAWLDEAAARKS
ncbi:universal stress protein [bacterium]|nr:universal stress protein [bacterium]